MAEKNEISILVKAEVAKAVNDLKAVANEGEKLGTKISNMASKIKANFAAVAGAAVALYASINKGAESVKMAAEFEEQSEAIKKQFGVDSKAMLESLRTATKGMVSDYKLQQLAARAMALGVTKDVGTLAQLFQYADIKGKALGKGIEETFSNIVEGIGKQNPRVLKELGFTTGAFKDVGDGAEGTMSKSEMLGIVMGEASTAIRDFGDDTLSTADKLAVASASTENLKLQLGDALKPVVESIIPGIHGLLSIFAKMPNSLKLIGIAMMALVPVAVALWTSLGPIGIVLGAVGIAAGAFAVKLGQITQQEDALIKKQQELEASFRKTFEKDLVAGMDASIGRFSVGLKNATIDMLNFTKAQLDSGKYYDELSKKFKTSTEQSKALAAAQLAAINAEIEARKTASAEEERLRVENQTKVAQFLKDEELANQTTLDKKLAQLKSFYALRLLTDEQNAALRRQIAETEDAIEQDRYTKKTQLADTYVVFIKGKQEDETENAVAELDKRYANAIAAANKLGLDTTALTASYAQQKYDIENAAAWKSAQSWMQAYASITSAAQTVGDAIMQITQNQVDAEIAAGGEMNAERKKRLRDAAIAQKAFAIFNSIIQGAQAVLAALATPVIGPVLAVAAGATAAVQAALIANEPIPEFATGGIVNGPTLAMVGERGREAVLPNELTELLLNAAGAGGGAGTSISIGQVVANDPQQFAQAMDRYIKRNGKLINT